eukprot:g11266.t1
MQWKGAKNTKLKDEVTALKAQILSMERRQSSVVQAAVQRTTQQLTLERERAVEEERTRSDQLEEQRSVAQLQNELLTEMVAAEQVNVKLQERRNEALKWELLRQGGCQEKFDNIAKEVPDLADTLRADTADVLHGVAKHDMSEAIEHVVHRIGDVKEDLQKAFLARDTSHSGALGGSAFKDALKESFPDMPREDRQLLMLRFIREVDQSVDYGERPKPFFATALMLSRPSSQPVPGVDASPFAGAGLEAGARRGTGRTDSVFTQGPNDPATEAAVRTKIAAKITRRGGDLEALLKARDPEGAGKIPVKAFSECLRSWDSSSSSSSKGSRSHPEGAEKANEGGGPGSEALTHADRKVLYRRWAVKGWVRYDDFLAGNGYYDAHLPRYSDVSTAIPAATCAAAGAGADAVGDTAPSATPASREEKRGNRSSLGRGGSGAGTGAATDTEEQGTKTEDEEKEVTGRARVVLAHLSQVLQDDGEEAYFAAFEAHDGDNFRCVDEDGFVDAIEILAPEVTTERALDLFRARAKLEEDDRADYDKLFKTLRRMAQPKKGFQSMDTVELRVERPGGSIDWVPAQVISKDEGGTYTVRFRSTEVPGGGARLKESGVPESDLREIVLLKPPPRRTSKSGEGFLTTVASWWGGGAKNKAKEGGKAGTPISSDNSSAYATEPERTPRRLSQASTGGGDRLRHRTSASSPVFEGSGGGGGGGGAARDSGLWSDENENEDEERDAVRRRASSSPVRSPSRSPSPSLSLSPSQSGFLSHSPASSLSPARRRSGRADGGGTRKMAELPVIQEGVSKPRGPTRRKSSGSRRAPAAGGRKRLSKGTGEQGEPRYTFPSEARLAVALVYVVSFMWATASLRHISSWDGDGGSGGSGGDTTRECLVLPPKNEIHEENSPGLSLFGA